MKCYIGGIEMRKSEEIEFTTSGLSSYDITQDENSYHLDEISSVLIQSMPQLRSSINYCSAVSNLKAIFIGLAEVPQHEVAHFVDGVCWTVTSLRSVGQVISAIEKGGFDYIFISIRGVDEFAPSIAPQLRFIPKLAMPEIIAFDDYVPKYLDENLIRSGVDRVIICSRPEQPHLSGPD